MEEVHGQHLIFIVIAEDVGVVAFGGCYALLFLQLLYGGDEVAIAGGALELLRFGGFSHALAQRLHQVGLPAFEKQLHVADGFTVDLGRGQVFHARAKATLDVVLQARARMVAGQIHFARRDQEVAMNQVDDAIGEIGREIGAVVGAAVLAQAAGHVHAGEALGQGQFHVGVSFVVAQQDVEARLLLLDEVILKRQRFFIIGYYDVVNVDGLADQRPGFRVLPAAFVEVGPDARAQVLRLAYVDDFAFGVLVQIHAGGRRDGADFLGKIHRATVYDRA